MRKLLSANFARMWKSRSFWLGVAVMCGILLRDLAKAIRYVLDAPGETIDPSVFLFMRCMLVLLVVAVFTGLFVGAEYSNKTLHNKIIAGHSRVAIYLANLVVCSSAGLMFYLAPMLLTLGLGLPLLGPIAESPRILLGTLLSSMATIIAAVSIFTALSMLISNHAIGVVAVVLVCLGMLSFSDSLRDALLEPEMAFESVIPQEDGTYEYNYEENPLYLRGAKRTVYQITFDFLPTGQMRQYSSHTLPEHVGRFPVYSGIALFLASAIGIWGFRKKDLA